MNYPGPSRGMYHRVTRLPHREGYVQCRQCDDLMSTSTIETIIQTCSADMRFRLTNGEAQITRMLDLYYGYSDTDTDKPVYVFFDLQSVIQNALDESQRYLNVYGDIPVIEYIENDVFNAIGINARNLQYTRESASKDGYYVGFISAHAARGFFSQLRNIQSCNSIIQSRT